MKKKLLNSVLITTLTIFGVSNFLNAQTSDCSPALFKDLRPGSSGSYPSNFREFNGSLFFSTYDGLWKSNGTSSGSAKIGSFSEPRRIEILNNNLIFSVVTASIWQLWKCDGTVATLIKEFPNAKSFDGIANLTSANGYMFFTVTENYITKLWRTDGTLSGTMMVKNIDPTNNINFDPTGIFEFNNKVYFRAGTTTEGMELWKSDGTALGTTIVKDINPGSSNGHTTPLYAILNNQLYFYANSALQYGLWKTDGTDAGTSFVKECVWISEISNINNVLYFSAYDIGANSGNTLYGEELWKSDGSPSGTFMVKDIRTGKNGSKQNSYQFKSINSMIVFTASDGINGMQLWKTNGTEAGTTILKIINPNLINAQIGLITSKVFNGFLYFSANNGINGSELWKTDGTQSGTTFVADLYPGSSSSGPSKFTLFNGNLFFVAESASAGNELWYCEAAAPISDIQLENVVSVYPNPSYGIFQLTVDNMQSSKGELEIYNVSGEKVYSAQNIKQQMQIDISAFSKGIYFIKVYTGTTIYNQKIIVQ